MKKIAKMFAGIKIIATFALAIEKQRCPDGGIGRRAGLKHQWSNIHPGSTPGLGTRKRAKYLTYQILSFLSCTQTRGRTGMEVNPLVFETSASTDSAIWAHT